MDHIVYCIQVFARLVLVQKSCAEIGVRLKCFCVICMFVIGNNYLDANLEVDRPRTWEKVA